MTTQPSAPLDPDVLQALLNQLEGSDFGRQLLFQSLLPQGVTNIQQAQYQSLYSPTFTRYLSSLGQQVRQGDAPDLTFDEFLAQEFDPDRALLRLPGATTALSGGRTIYDFA